MALWSVAVVFVETGFVFLVHVRHWKEPLLLVFPLFLALWLTVPIVVPLLLLLVVVLLLW